MCEAVRPANVLAVVLNSGGVDSTTAVGLAVKEVGAENVVTVSAFYGQKHRVELECAQKVAEYYGVRHIEINLAEIMQYSNCPLLSKSTEEIRHESYAEQIAKDGEGMVRTYVPFRNGLLLSSVAAIAVSLMEGTNYDFAQIYLGAHADDAAGEAYADCSKEFTDTMYKAISIGTYGKVKVKAPFVQCTKKDIVHLGLQLGVPYQLTHSCYEGERPCCGTCGTCIDRIAAFVSNGVADPVEYKIPIDWDSLIEDMSE